MAPRIRQRPALADRPGSFATQAALPCSPNVTRHRDIFEEIVRLRQAGIPAALATIVGTRGSTPGRTSMRLLVLGDGTFLGTVGGGCLEAEVYDIALQVLADEQPRSFDSPNRIRRTRA